MNRVWSVCSHWGINDRRAQTEGTVLRGPVVERDLRCRTSEFWLQSVSGSCYNLGEKQPVNHVKHSNLLILEIFHCLHPWKDYCSLKAQKIAFLAMKFLKIFLFYWNIVDLQCCVSFRCTAKWFSYTYIHSFLDSYAGYQRTLSRIPCAIYTKSYIIYSSVYMFIPSSWFIIPLHISPLVTISLFSIFL